jgi:hypothetical protein
MQLLWENLARETYRDITAHNALRLARPASILGRDKKRLLRMNAGHNLFHQNVGWDAAFDRLQVPLSVRETRCR